MDAINANPEIVISGEVPLVGQLLDDPREVAIGGNIFLCVNRKAPFGNIPVYGRDHQTDRMSRLYGVACLNKPAPTFVCETDSFFLQM